MAAWGWHRFGGPSWAISEACGPYPPDWDARLYGSKPVDLPEEPLTDEYPRGRLLPGEYYGGNAGGAG